MARQELQRRLEELDMSAIEAKGYGQLLQATQSHMMSLYDLLEREFGSFTVLSSYLMSLEQISLQKKKSVYGLNGRLMANWTIRDLRRVLRVNQPSTRDVRWRNQSSGGRRSSGFRPLPPAVFL